jgi:DNA segregation ATPase FtsK/SpoIIIE-like protein
MAETAAPAVVPLLDEGAPSLDEGASWLDEGAMDEHTAEAMIAGVVVSRAADAPPAPREAVQLLFDGVAPGETPLPELVKEYDRHESPAATLTSAVAPAVPETGAGRTRSGRRQRNKSNLVVNTTPVADAPPAPAIVQPTFDEILSKEGTDDATPAEPSNIDRAIRMVLGEGRASISFLQRKLEVSFGDAQHLMGELESQGIVGPYRGNPARDILLTLSEWEARRAQ